MVKTIRDAREGTHAVTIDAIYEFPGKGGQKTGYEFWCRVCRDLTDFWCDHLVLWTTDDFAHDTMMLGKLHARPVLVTWAEKDWGREITGCELYEARQTA